MRTLENSVTKDAQDATEAALNLFYRGRDADMETVWSISSFLSDLISARDEVSQALKGKNKNWLIEPPKESC